MDPTIEKTLFTATDGQGRELLLALFSDGRWGITVAGQRQAESWPYAQLAAAARAYRHRVFDAPSSRPRCSSPPG